MADGFEVHQQRMGFGDQIAPALLPGFGIQVETSADPYTGRSGMPEGV